MMLSGSPGTSFDDDQFISIWQCAHIGDSFSPNDRLMGFIALPPLGEVVVSFYNSESQMELGAGPEFMEIYILNGLIVLVTIYILVRVLLRYFVPPDAP
jgi:hypothetical protein